MHKQQSTEGSGINRRDVLKASALGVGAMAFGLPAMSSLATATSHETYTLTQNGTDYTVTAVTYDDGTGLVPIQDFYNYASSANPGGSNTPLDIEQNKQSRMFLYRDDTGLYLVFLHDNYWAGGPSDVKDWQAYFEFTGLPTGGSWVVDEGNDPADDFGDSDQFYWRWFPRYSDGGAYGMLSCEPGEEFSITVTPDFNPNPGQDVFQDAPASEPWLDADGWKFYNGDEELISLDEAAELTVSCDTCDPCPEGFEVKFEYDEENDTFAPELEDDMTLSGLSYDSYVTKGTGTDEVEMYEPVAVTFHSDYCSLDATVKAAGEHHPFESLSPDADGYITIDLRTLELDKLHAMSNIVFSCSE